MALWLLNLVLLVERWCNGWRVVLGFGPRGWWRADVLPAGGWKMDGHKMISQEFCGKKQKYCLGDDKKKWKYPLAENAWKCNIGLFFIKVAIVPRSFLICQDYHDFCNSVFVCVFGLWGSRVRDLQKRGANFEDLFFPGKLQDNVSRALSCSCTGLLVYISYPSPLFPVFSMTLSVSIIQISAGRWSWMMPLWSSIGFFAEKLKFKFGEFFILLVSHDEKNWRFVGVDVFCSCFVLTKLCTSFLVYLFPLCFWYLVHDNPKKTEPMPFGVIHVCLVGENVILKLQFGSLSRCSTTFVLVFPLELCFCFPSVFPFSPVQKVVVGQPRKQKLPKMTLFQVLQGGWQCQRLKLS